MDDWPFADPRNVAVFTVAAILDGRRPILVVTHDEDDGAWQFLTGDDLPDEPEWKLVALEEMAELDPSITVLADLPFGWYATRARLDGAWQRRARER